MALSNMHSDDTFSSPSDTLGSKPSTELSSADRVRLLQTLNTALVTRLSQPVPPVSLERGVGPEIEHQSQSKAVDEILRSISALASRTNKSELEAASELLQCLQSLESLWQLALVKEGLKRLQ